MAQRPRILLVLVEGLAETVIDSAVLEHARDSRDQGVADFTVWAFCWSRGMRRLSQARLARAQALAGCEIRLLRGLRPGLPGSLAFNALRLRLALLWRGRRPDLIHARDAYATALCAAARPRGTPLIWDCRGDGVAESAERLAARAWLPGWMRRLKQRAVERIHARAARACDGLIFVSRELAETCRHAVGDKPSAIIPCAASEGLFYFDPELRARTRAALGYARDQRVFVYCGSLAPYQCFGDVVGQFAAIAAQDERARLLVVTPDVETARRETSGLDRAAVRIVSAALGEVNPYLNAADAAFMTRRTTAANAVASPVKFAEYSLAGLPVIMNEAVRDAWRQAGEIGNRAALDGARLQVSPTFQREEVARRARLLLGKQRFAHLYGALVRMTLGRRTASPREAQAARPVGLQ